MNNETQQNNSFKEEILKKISAGEVSMRPRAYFVLKMFILVFVVIVTTITSILLISYTLFILHTGGHVFLLGFGAKGIYEFLMIFPWLLLIFNIILLLFLDFLLKRFKFAYNRPILYVFLGTLVAITLCGSLFNFTSFHKDMMYRAEGKRLPFGGGFYQGLRKSHKANGIFRGEVVSIASSTFVISHNEYDTDDNYGTVRVLVPSGFVIDTFLSIGDEVFIAGDVVNNDIKAYGIQKIEDN